MRDLGIFAFLGLIAFLLFTLIQTCKESLHVQVNFASAVKEVTPVVPKELKTESGPLAVGLPKAPEKEIKKEEDTKEDNDDSSESHAEENKCYIGEPQELVLTYMSAEEQEKEKPILIECMNSCNQKNHKCTNGAAIQDGYCWCNLEVFGNKYVTLENLKEREQ